MKVYVLNGGCVDDKYVIGVFSSMKNAEARRQQIIEKDNFYKNNSDLLDIDIFELNGEIIYE